MPIDITNLTQSAKTVQTYNPKFFSSKLTGSGKTQGVLNQARNPGNVLAPKPITPQHLSTRKRHYTNGGTSIYELPFNVLTQPMWNYMKTYTPDGKTLGSRVCIGNMTTMANCDIYLDMRAHSIIMDETRNQTGIGYDRRISACYQVFLYFEFSKGQADYKQETYLATLGNVGRAGNVAGVTRQKQNAFIFTFTTDPRQEFEKIRYDLDSQGCYVDVVAMQDYLADFSLYAAVCRESEVWQTNCHELIEQVLQNVNHTQDVTTLNDTANMLIALEQYPIPLDIYRPIYQSVARHFTQDRALVLCKQNLNLLLNDTLFTLNAKKGQLSKIPNPTQPVPSKVPLSKAQLDTVTTNEPLVLVQSGAGSGKSTVILNRLTYMVNSGVKPEDITVISFTNAAADHIKEEQSLVHSMTACAMINTIYKANFPNHELNTMESLASTIKALYPDTATNPQHKIARRFADHIDNMESKRGGSQESNPQTRLNNFVERHLDEVLKILDEVGQTTLELQIIICYQLIDKLQEPDEIKTRYLIIDEVQDNSVFEFIYFLRYAYKNDASLFMVG